MKHSELVRKVAADPLHWPAFGFGLGLIPFAPGTWGSLPGILIWWLVPANLALQIAVGAFLFLIGI